MDFFSQAEEMRKKEAENSLDNKPSAELIERLDEISNVRDKKVKAEELTKTLYKRAIDNIKISEWERIKINKHNFEDKDEVIDILLYTVGKMALDPVFYDLNIKKLKDHIPLYTKDKG